MATQAGPGLREEKPRGNGQEWGAVLLRLLAALAVLAAVYVGAALYFQDRPPAGVSVAGVDVGGLPHDEAVARLRSELADQEATPVSVQVRAVGADGATSSGGAGEGEDAGGEDTTITLDPAEAGLAYDYEASLDGLTGFSLDPRTMWAHVARSDRELPLVGTVDREALRSAVEAQARDYDEEPVEGDVRLVDGAVEVVDARAGRELDVDATADAFAQAWPEAPDPGTTVEAASLPPSLTQAEVERFTSEEVGPALGSPLVVTGRTGTGDKAEKATAEVPPREIAPMLSIDHGEDHTLSLELDEEAMLTRLRQDLGQLERGPLDATVRLGSDGVEVVPARAGAALDEDELVSAVREALTAEGEDRAVTTELAVVEPEIPTSVSEGWEFSRMGSFTSEFPGGPANEDRSHNIRTAIRHLNGDVVMPGEQFSLAAALSPVTPEEGYREAPIIVDGRLVMGLGGGLSQVSTTVFNAAWFSGVQLDAHTPHSFYIPRYPAGREATIVIPGLDNQWTNDTDTPVVIRTWVSGQEIFMEFLGDRQYTVETVEGPRQNIQEPERIEDDSPECVTQVASPGFTIYVARILSRGGEAVHRDEYTTTYIPEDEVVCSHPDAN